MDEKLNIKQRLLIGSLLFGLFFGAGNLIFPVELGQAAGSSVGLATIGFLITGVGLPILGIIGSALSESDSLFDMASLVSRSYALFFTCALYLTIGPLFAIPRTATVAFEVGVGVFIAKEYINVGLFIFSLIFFAITLYFSLRPGKILDWIGKYLTPIFLILLSTLLLITYIKPMGQVGQFPPQGDYVSNALFRGFLDGYNTMDALASLAFAIIITSSIKKMGVDNPRIIAVETAKSGLVAIIGMTIIYGSLAYMGATSLGSVSRASNGGVILSMVSEYYYGVIGKILLAAIVAVACLKTAIGLITACSSIFSEMFPNSISYSKYAVLFTLSSLVIANFGLENIIKLSVPVLMFLYPLAIALIILSLLTPFIDKNRYIYSWTIGMTLVFAVFDLLNALPDSIKDSKIMELFINFAKNYLPGFEYGFGWVIPAIIGFIIGYIRKQQD